MKRFASFRIMILFAAALGLCGTGSSADPAPSGKELADALVAVSVDEMTWIRGVALLPFAIEIGIPEDQVFGSQPGAGIDKLPRPVQAALRLGADALPAWRDCLKDERPTGVSQSDLFGGGSSDKAPKISCSDAAATVIFSMVPTSVFKKPDPNGQRTRQLIEQAATEWEAQIRGKTPAERMQIWFDKSDEPGRQRFLAVVIGLRHAAAYPLIEANFRERSKAPDVYLLLEYSAYVRHRRAAVKDFTAELTGLLRNAKWKDREGPTEFFYQMWKLLTEYDSLQPAVDRWRKGELDTQTLRTLIERSIDRPWAYHSMPLEPASVFRPTMEQNLRTLVAAATEEKDLKKRVQLLELSEMASELLTDVMSRVTDTEKRPMGASSSAEWKPMVAQLRELLQDQRIYDDGRMLSTPAHSAASIVYHLWWERSGARDWRNNAIHFYKPGQRSLSDSLAEDLLARPELTQQQDYPEVEAKALITSLGEANAAAWRARLGSLPWEQRLLVQEEMREDQDFAVRFWPRLIEFVEWSGTAEKEPASFAALWQEKLAGRSISVKTWPALQDWLVAEARAGRYWTIVGESYPVRPGLSLLVRPTASKGKDRQGIDRPTKGPVLRIRVDGPFEIRAGEEWLHITSDGLETIAPPENAASTRDLHDPLYALIRQKTLPKDDRERAREGFILRMEVMPPSHEVERNE